MNSSGQIEDTIRRGFAIEDGSLGLSLKAVAYHVKSLWLFTFSDLKTIVGPKTAFGVLNSLYANTFGFSSPPKFIWIIVATTMFWVWINLLPFLIDNQRQPESIAEDKLNKPWRPMPSGRLTPLHAKRLMSLLYLLAVISSMRIGGLRQCMSMMILGYWYNDHGGAANCVTRNLINALGFVCYASGAMEVALGSQLPLDSSLSGWFLMIGAVVFTKVQDLYDQDGDRACGRKTLPLVAGDGPSRWITVIPLMLWSVVCPWYWDCDLDISLAFFLVGCVIAARLILKRQVDEDKISFMIWNGWMVFLYCLPHVWRSRV